MTYLVTAPQQTAFEQVVVPLAYFVEMQFISGTQRVCNFNRTIPWGGFDWIGLGALGNISEIKSSEKIQPESVTLGLSIAQSAWLAFGVGPVEEYRGLPVKIYNCPLDFGYQLIDNPMLAWDGLMDVVAVSVEGQGGNIQLRCEPASKKLRRSNALRVNAAQQKLYYPNDTGFDFQIGLIANPQTWVSAKFQRIE